MVRQRQPVLHIGQMQGADVGERGFVAVDDAGAQRVLDRAGGDRHGVGAEGAQGLFAPGIGRDGQPQPVQVGRMVDAAHVVGELAEAAFPDGEDAQALFAASGCK